MTFNDLNKFLNIFKEYPNARIYVYGEEDGYFYGCRMFFSGDDDIYEVFKRMNKFSYCRYFLDTNPTEILYDEWKIEQLTEIS